MVESVYKFGNWMPSIFKNDPFESLTRDFNSIFGCDCDCCKRDKDDNLIYTLDVPGFNKDNLKVEVAEGILTISGESEVRKQDSYSRGRIMKRFKIGEIEDAEATVKDGILTIKLKYPSKEISVKNIKVSDGICDCNEDEECCNKWEGENNSSVQQAVLLTIVLNT